MATKSNKLWRHRHTIIPHSSRELGSKIPCQKKGKSANNWQALKNSVLVLSIFFYFLGKTWWELLLSSLRLLVRLVVWLEAACELSNQFDAPLNWRVRMMYFYCWGDTAESEEWIYSLIYGRGWVIVRCIKSLSCLATPAKFCRCRSDPPL
jgi:hypothetical protein